jgi:flagella synthesis protein FlgN
LADLLAEEAREVDAFSQLLREEQKLLASAGNAEALLPLDERKTQFTLKLRAIAERREHYLAAKGFAPGRAGMEACLAAAPESGELQAKWRQLLKSAKEVRALNETNGKLISIHWQHNQQALKALMSAAEGAMVYGPDGQQTSGTGGSRFRSSA